MENNEEEKTLTPQEKLAEFQAQKMTRRQALGRFGFLAGAAAVAALSVDELTRLAGNEMSRRATGNKAVEQVAKEFQNAGVAHALPCYALDEEGNPLYDPQGNPLPCGYHPPSAELPVSCVGIVVGDWCKDPAKGGHGPGDPCKHCCDGVYGPVGMCKGLGDTNPPTPGDLALCKQRCGNNPT
jgi:hypothetical protein